ncbi:MAG: GNAT family N-acetyltransferase [Sphingobacteriales bacterium 17-39-43]|uniref:GNAT family N-acetyltransferase n=1 Tax=Daejeonella sp. TaxID=2805397 RepID=UPI000BC9D192|nr:GNAT family N-acetyltransferase [Daejeonella sp.]OYZ32052.1 MAG: GNAT family N-acetyltransferase [Sphingobacteriales bacterium 16-39-50]OZA25356.1 MAG: GNAT family N-acetyltransferase [Sphingobacteriales bacterium 17-39-43]HQS04912.1 GNAT family N-acetyltransferase [Daejeonella sp.]HQS51805.1 GNAT family N-acetyltransferase [Daejeonella sp.]HQT22603.1 GNAT family N-acetyltransferase [Daejeonella sp.]
MEIVLLEKQHNRESFNSSTPLLDEYIKKQASQDVKRDLSACYVLTDNEGKVLAYYTLSSNSIPREGLPEELLKKLRLPPSYQNLPAIMLGRLAVDQEHKGKGYGKFLLQDAFEKCLLASDSIGSLAIIVDPIDDSAVAFYKKYGFINLEGSSRMFIPMKTIRELINP